MVLEPIVQEASVKKDPPCEFKNEEVGSSICKGDFLSSFVACVGNPTCLALNIKTQSLSQQHLHRVVILPSPVSVSTIYFSSPSLPTLVFLLQWVPVLPPSTLPIIAFQSLFISSTMWLALLTSTVHVCGVMRTWMCSQASRKRRKSSAFSAQRVTFVSSVRGFQSMSSLFLPPSPLHISPSSSASVLELPSVPVCLLSSILVSLPLFADVKVYGRVSSELGNALDACPSPNLFTSRDFQWTRTYGHALGRKEELCTCGSLVGGVL